MAAVLIYRPPPLCKMTNTMTTQLRLSGNTLTGVAVRYNEVSPQFRERIQSGAFSPLPSTIPINLQHDANIKLVANATLTDTDTELRVSAELPPQSGYLELVKRQSLNGFSIEFIPETERMDDGIRVIEKAKLTAVALVDIGAYPSARPEVRCYTLPHQKEPEREPGESSGQIRSDLRVSKIFL